MKRARARAYAHAHDNVIRPVTHLITVQVTDCTGLDREQIAETLGDLIAVGQADAQASVECPELGPDALARAKIAAELTIGEIK